MDSNGSDELTESNGNGNRPAAAARPIKRHVELSQREFDVDTLPADMRRVYGHLSKRFGEDYGLLFIFTMRTAVELHRAWNMTLLTSNILQQIKDEFGLRMTWNLGVVRLKFRVEDGAFELHRKVPYDYDSENQDIYYRIAVALIEGRITVHEALLYQSEAKQGIHTASSGLFLRDFPGRIVLYPLQAATCAVIFFNGKWIDAGVAAICGLAAGLLEYALSHVGGMAKMLVDVVVGISAGIIGGLWYNYDVSPCCLSSIFLGTLYWFFYGTAFVIGLLEIIAGELETGVTRFVAVSVKTFVLSLGASLGLMASSGGDAIVAWTRSEEHCDENFVKGMWYRVPLYLLCSVAVLGQYRLPISQYWRGLIVQFVAYEIQYQVMNEIKEVYNKDHLDTALSNIAGGAGGVISACALSWVINRCKHFYSARLLQEGPSANSSRVGNLIYLLMRCGVKTSSCLRIGRKSDVLKFDMEKKLRDQHEQLNDPGHPRDRIDLPKDAEDLFLETVVGAQSINIWAILMPAVYQLVPGSIIARLWFHSIFPPEEAGTLATNITENDNGKADNLEVPMTSQESVFSNLMVISTSLALGLIFGFSIVQLFSSTFGRLAMSCSSVENEKIIENRKRMNHRMEGMYTAQTSPDDDPWISDIPANDATF
mmetsp:Transcript_26627/g.63859  ORF Transcript_26627/g.63859 Transcript_26627/m.63859 type:complete len:653 (+) Transcript_26627:35-1993(+)|eukprot:CAMPEP_0181119782 /NCGR_PEP_ID=MMETSP1071-20121207/23784_1 /TAXON_ID=35127 /ORGANISM="Thalassiosira sp., Strain NH16" /LENGTH=652 /DNA_ID=CAMNT_0023204349 /DNA_START=23 /DNA_END=1981 /DNA_ORIENTATION=-